MKSASDQNLLQQYCATGSEVAFSELVRRHVDLVYSVALRIVREQHLAEDVTQSVFAALARDAGKLAKHPVLVGWLHRTAQNLAANGVRENVRRRAREEKAAEMQDTAQQESWEIIEPHVEEGLAALSESDRAVLLQRYFQGKTAREIGSLHEISEEAAQKRISRALERLRAFLGKKGVAIPAGALAASLAENSVKAAPSGLAGAVSEAILHDVLRNGAAAAVAKGISMTTTQKAVVGVSLGLVLGTGVYEIHQTNRRAEESRLAAADQARLSNALREQETAASAQFAALQAENARLKAEAAEVHRLRGEVTNLRSEAAKAAVAQQPQTRVSEVPTVSVLDRVQWFKRLPQEMPDKAIPELGLLNEDDWLELANHSLAHWPQDLDPGNPEPPRRMLQLARERAKMKLGFLLSKALDEYRNAHQDQLPPNTMQLLPLFLGLSHPLGGKGDFVTEAMLSRYSILRTGYFEDVPQEHAVILAEKAPADPIFDSRLIIGRHWLKTAKLGDAAHWKSESGLPTRE